MPLTRSFKETVQARVRRDAAFREALLREGVDAMLSGDLGTGKAVLRGHIHAPVDIEVLSDTTGTPPSACPACSAHAAILRPAICW